LKKIALLAITTLFTTAAFAADNSNYGKWGIDTAGMDTSVKPGDDFFKYANGKWAATTQIPGDKTSYGSFDVLEDLSESEVHGMLDTLAASKDLKPGSDEAKIATVYRTFLDEATAEKLDNKPLVPYINEVKNVKTREDLARIMGRSSASFGTSLYFAFVNDDQKNPDKYALYFYQAGLGLPDREYYLRDNFKEQREHYVKYVADMLKLSGWANPEKNAADILAFETRLAEAHWTRAESRDRDKTYNPYTLAELEKNAPGFDWAAAFKGAGIQNVDKVVVFQNTAFPKMAAIFGSTPLETLKAWEAFHMTDEAAPYLSKRFVDTRWAFRSKYLQGTEEQRPRWKRAVGTANEELGEAIGRAYVARYFPPESKAKMESLVNDLLAAMKARIENVAWMGPETKAKALEKLSKFGVKIGYPAKWRDYSGLKVVEGDLAGNALRSGEFEWAYQRNRIGKQIDRGEWAMTPQTVNAYYTPVKNEIVFPAAILQPPFFNPTADPAVNYGAIGAVIGHEITHGFDDQGRKSDGTGMLKDWWTADDAKKFDAEAAKLGAQYEAVDISGLPGLHIIGKQTMGENIGDLGGVLLGLDAYRISLKGQPAPTIDGFTGDQRVFLGWAQVWRALQRTDALRQQLMTDPHSPDQVRAMAPLRNVDAWYAAFGVKEGDREYVKPEDRVRIW